jgi:hypothetical protein
MSLSSRCYCSLLITRQRPTRSSKEEAEPVQSDAEQKSGEEDNSSKTRTRKGKEKAPKVEKRVRLSLFYTAFH